MFEVRMPQKGLTETSAYLSKWYVGEGDRVKTGDYLFAMETSKSVFDVESEADGTVIAVLYPEGEEVDVESVVCVIGKEGESYEGSASAAPSAKESPAPAVSEAEEAPQKPEVSSAPFKADIEATSAPKENLPYGDRGKTAISPRAKAKAEELGIDYGRIVPTGPEGRIIEEDILSAYEKQKTENISPAPAAPAGIPQTVYYAAAPGALAFAYSAVETKLFTVSAEELFAYEAVLSAVQEEGRTMNTREDMILHAVLTVAGRHSEYGRGLPVFFAGSGAPYFAPAIDPAAGWSLGVGSPKKELPDGSGDTPVRTVTFAFVYDIARFDRDAVDAFAAELKDAIEHFTAFLAYRA